MSELSIPELEEYDTSFHDRYTNAPASWARARAMVARVRGLVSAVGNMADTEGIDTMRAYGIWYVHPGAFLT